ncbi:TonB-dependent receptor [Citrobacter rodentium]|jgi:TonB-dependent siderophore receptor|uniref:Tonb dependent receptor n=2 Tax=Citrobacter rodentium TaxID=67825 RepID=D2TPF1_CITRI|nr:TonB-dependent siderophore receptor [Citrobacter rodentium]KIQ52282.1 fatty-acid--CoA ligase [Citrobacter rodentium]QBY27387.1 TonB-dependent siderophore receptor [Citrobacter rodentium]UHO30699.1 TonB-dependent siderophore receptor [Citrobacter rodentium NBRC 105723 = DSM 16636]CBG87520.1 putative tonb dependent receptor [Citrobacter rodentium ICC168]HAT8013383.1 TonB-dependent siderophore receptor [Citrobacter rodentium NBRC 105723 = DSM 16636]
MNKFPPRARLLSILIAVATHSVHAASFSEENIIVTPQTPENTAQASSGAGFKTDDIEMGPLGNKTWVDTPFSTTTVTHEMISNQRAQSVSELLKYSPSTQMQARGGMDVGRPQSRGMQGSVVANSRLDGLNIVSTTAFPVEMLERLDILNSLTGALYGPASPAGQFNFVAKRPTEQTLREVTMGYQSRSAFNGHVDLGGHFDDEHRFGYRLNLADQEGEGNLADSTLRRKLLSVALDWNLQPGTQLQLDASHYEFIQKGYPGSFSYGPDVKLPSAPDPKNSHLALSTAGNDLTTDTISTRLIHYLNDDWTLTAGVGWQQADRAMRSVSSKIINSQGDISRSMKDSTAAGRFRVLSNTVTLNGHVDTGSIGHDIALSTTGYIWSLYSAKGSGTSYRWDTTNMYHPSALYEQGDGKISTGGARYKSSVNTQQSITLGDTLTLTPKWSAMFFLSQSWLQSQNFDKSGHQSSQIDENGLSPNAALMYKITPDVMAYVSYAESLEQGGTAPTDSDVKNAGQTLDPYRSKQYEVGLKADAAGMNLGAALFRLERPFAYVDPDDNTYKEQGNQVNHGLEFTATGQVVQGLNIFSGITLLDPKLKDTASAATRNKQVVGVPKIQANLLAEYSLPSMPQWVYSANVHYTGKRAANDTNTAWAGSYTTWDLGTRYTTKISQVPTTFRVVVNNVFDKHYWASIFPSGTDGDNGSPSAFLGSGREIRASVTFDF